MVKRGLGDAYQTGSRSHHCLLEVIALLLGFLLLLTSAPDCDVCQHLACQPTGF